MNDNKQGRFTQQKISQQLKGSNGTCYNVNESCYTKWKKPNINGHILYDSVSIQFPEKLTLLRRKKIGGCQGLGGRELQNDHLMDTVFFWGDENI